MILNNTQTADKISAVKGIEIKNFRKRLKISQQKLADNLRVSRMTIYRWETEQRHIPEFLELALETVERNLKKQDN